MESTHLLSTSLNIRENTNISVLPIGFDVALVERIKNIFKLERQAKHSYRVAAPDAKDGIAVLLINHDNSMSLHKKDMLLRTTCPNAQVVIVSQGPLANPTPHHIRGMLTASRLLSVLDKLPLSYPPTPQVKQDTPAIPQISQTTADPAKPTQLLHKPDIPIISLPVTTPAETTGYRALVVDDSIAIQMAIKLKLQGIEQITQIDFADDGHSALEKSAAIHYDLIFLDVMMPGIDGYETCTQLRKMPDYKKTPIIMVSGKTSPLDEVKGVMAGCTTYLSKPVDDQAFHKLSVRVLNWLADRKMVGATQ